MHPMETSYAAFQLGFDLQQLKWKAFRDGYDEKRDGMQDALRALGVDVDLPATVDAFSEAQDDIFSSVYQHLKHERSNLGGDVFALTSFMLGYAPLELVLSAAWQSDNYEVYLAILNGILIDLDVEGEFEAIKKVIDLETEWLRQESAANAGDLRSEDALRAAARLLGRVMTAWRTADQRRDLTVRFDAPPYHSVFISYSQQDEEFCRKLHDSLSEVGLRVWFAPHDIQAGQKLHRQIYSAIEEYDKLLVVLSDASMGSEWVGTELWKARERERTQDVQVLFPIRIVPFERLRDWSAFDADSGKDMAREIREYYVPDFSEWRDDDAFANGLTRLIDGLIVESPAAPQPEEVAAPGER